MTGFTFCREYYDTAKKIKNKKDRDMFILAVLEFMFEDKEPIEVSDLTQLAFDKHRKSLEISKKRGNNGKIKRSRTKIKTKSNEDQTVNKLQSNENQNENKTGFDNDLISVCSQFDFQKKESIPTQKESNKEKNNTLERKLPPLLSPQGEGEKGEKSAKDRFFETYPTVRANLRYFKGDDSHIDYNVLLERFASSAELRKKYSFSWIVANYESIKSGFFDDKARQKESVTEALDVKAERERWYAKRRQNAESIAEKIRKRFMQDEQFAKIDRRLKAITIEQAKAELKGDKKTLARLEQEQARLTLQRRGIIERNGMSEDDLLPKWHCQKCQDTGFLPNGFACDCYEKEK